MLCSIIATLPSFWAITNGPIKGKWNCIFITPPKQSLPNRVVALGACVCVYVKCSWNILKVPEQNQNSCSLIEHMRVLFYQISSLLIPYLTLKQYRIELDDNLYLYGSRQTNINEIQYELKRVPSPELSVDKWIYTGSVSTWIHSITAHLWPYSGRKYSLKSMCHTINKANFQTTDKALWIRIDANRKLYNFKLPLHITLLHVRVCVGVCVCVYVGGWVG